MQLDDILSVHHMAFHIIKLATSLISGICTHQTTMAAPRARRVTYDESPAEAKRSSGWLRAIALATAAALATAYYVSPSPQPSLGPLREGHTAALGYGPIDVVYTWVNGTDPRWKAEKEYWHKHWIASLTGQPLPVAPEDTTKVKGSDTSNNDNRFRDNEELRYSLRSLEKYAPWIRHVFVVTDGQVPSWLNLECPKIQIVKHADIFEYKEHLPVFSSPAIEWNLDNIPGLSDFFLYFNDDVFLGSHVHPEDFVSPMGVQKTYLAWEIPQCDTHCIETFLQNGRCDKACNVSACDFDMGDCGCDVDPFDGTVACDPVKIQAIEEAAAKPVKIAHHMCAKGCNYKWLNDGGCDPACNNTACGFDAGDCEGTSLWVDLHTADLTINNTLVQVPLNESATYLNLTDVFGVNGSITAALHDNGDLIRHATVFETEMLVMLVFGHDTEGQPHTSSASITIQGTDLNGNKINYEFSVTRGNTAMVSENDEEGGFASYLNTSIRPQYVRLPFGFRQAVFETHNGQVRAEEPSESKSEQEGTEGDAAGVVDDLKAIANDDPFVTVFLPFNLTGKHWREFDELTLGYDLSLRLHDEENDFIWSDFQICHVRIPVLSVIDVENEQARGDATDRNEESSASDDVSGEDVEAGSAVDDAEAGIVSVGDVEAGNAADDAEASISVSFDDLTEQEDREVVENESHDLEELDDGLQWCQFQENHGIIVKLRVPTHYARAHGLVSRISLGHEDSPAAHDEASQDGASATTPPKSPVEKARDIPFIGYPPQLTDGEVCFYDAEADEPKRYCFDLAMGHFHAHRELVQVKPPVVQDIYEPYKGENEALLELDENCVDTTERFVGLEEPVCAEDEVPVLSPSEDEDSVSAEDIEPEVDENTREGKRLACEAKRRRQQERSEREALEAKNGGNGTFAAKASAWISSVILKAKQVLGIDTLEPTDEVLDDEDYGDVCDESDVPVISDRDANALLSKDTFGDSLRFVNKLYNRAFGKVTTHERRRVPSHMPFMLQKKIIREMKERWPAEFKATSAHRFRHPEDMQFSFSYFHYLMNRHKVHPPTLEFIWREYLDSNRNGILDENEVLTVASLAHGDYPPDSFVDEVRECLQPPKQDKVRELSTATGTVRVTETLTPYIQLENLQACPDIVDKLVQNVRQEKLHELMPETEVTFHMLSDNYRFAWNQMLGTRARRTKFVCINDDMKYPSTRVSQILHELFLSIWPKKSQFELPFHLKNRFAHIDEYAEARSRRHMYAAGAGVVVLILMLIFRKDLKAVFGFQDIARSRAQSASQLSAEFKRRQSGAPEENESSEPKED